MTAWTDILIEAISAAGQPGDLLAPTTLLEPSGSLDNPLTTLSWRDTEHKIFAALDPDLEFVRSARSSGLTIKADQKEKLASSIRWLIGTLSGWRQAEDPAYARLMAMIAVAARLDEDGALWLLMPEAIGQNQELGQVLADILGRLQFRAEAAGFSRSPIVDSEQIGEFSRAEAEQNWSILRFFVENTPFRFQSSGVVEQSVRLLNRFFPDRLIEMGRAVSQVGIAMPMITAISIGDAFGFATKSGSATLQFAAICRLFSIHDRVLALDAAQEGALVALLKQVATDEPRWTACMRAFVAHPYRATLMQPAIGRYLATSDEAALRAYIDAIVLQPNWLGRDEVKACLDAFANCVSLERRQAAWRMAFARWSDWNFGERDGHSTFTGTTLSNMDFAIVGYAVECLTLEEREAQIAGYLDIVGRAEDVWHKSQRDFMHYIYRALSRVQAFFHARDCGTDRNSWLWNRSRRYLLNQLDDPYWQLRYFLPKLPDGRSQEIGTE